MRVGLVADTHGRFDPLLTRIFAGCDRIVHAGDVVGQEILGQLAVLAPVVAVRGNNDVGTLGVGLEEVAAVRFEGVKAVVIHELGKPHAPSPGARAALEREVPDLVIFGHSHQPLVQKVGGRLFVNPGSAGPRRFSLPRAAGIAAIEDRRIRVELFDLERAVPALLNEPFEAVL